ncbi:MAG: sigma 54-interacting transcriptional regulator [Deltaproteobacteria bacterium]|nr:sigma 54-interacting transcriptional regulator [Deltaproteobacteria bacterium]
MPSNHLIEAALLERQLARKALKEGRKDQAWDHLLQALGRLSAEDLGVEGKALLAPTCLEFSNLCFRLGRGFSNAITFLQTAREAADQSGDRRSGALAKLHLGRLFYFAERRSEALEVFEQGKADVEKLGDEDLITEAAEFIGLYYFFQGRFIQAQEYFQRASRSFEGESDLVINLSGPMWLSYCAAYLGQFHLAIGTLDYYRRLASERGDKGLAATFRAVLGIILLFIKKTQEASLHLSGVLQESIKLDNILAKYFARGGLAYYHLLEGRTAEARNLLNLAVSEGAASGLIRQYASPFILEMLSELHRHGCDPIPHLHYSRELQRVMQEANVHLQGVALRLRATEAVSMSRNHQEIETDLKKSEECLIQSGDPIQLGKTWLEQTRLSLRLGHRGKARSLAQKAWKSFSGYGEVFFPDDLRHLITLKNDESLVRDSRDEFLPLFMEIIQSLTPNRDLARLLTQTVTATNRFFGAERGGIFWFARGRNQRTPELRAACNLGQGDVTSEDFRFSLSLIHKAKREHRPFVVRHQGPGRWPNQIKALLCVPFEVDRQTSGVMYHDNSYVDDCFEWFDIPQLVQMASALTIYIDQLMRFTQRMERRTREVFNSLDQADRPEIITASPAMKAVLQQADKVSEADSSVLILGETGVGKELLAHHIHKMSRRRNQPFVIVDPTTIPDNLAESELFGHEKGYFTGAERQKIGRMEFADQGTLFIDEVGEMPMTIQVKLLRALQEKVITRVGSNQEIKTDFRLIAATNRDLAARVASGNFREDLFYRLNVVPLYLPPLRERREDIPLLIHSFLNSYAIKYNRTGLHFSPQEERRALTYGWPGNIRELKNVIERAVILSTGDRVALDIPEKNNSIPDTIMSGFSTLDEIQSKYIQYVLGSTNGKIGGPGGAAEILGMKRTSLINRMKKLGLR